jgi:hypothetical protein
LRRVPPSCNGVGGRAGRVGRRQRSKLYADVFFLGGVSMPEDGVSMPVCWGSCPLDARTLPLAVGCCRMPHGLQPNVMDAGPAGLRQAFLMSVKRRCLGRPALHSAGWRSWPARLGQQPRAGRVGFDLVGTWSRAHKCFVGMCSEARVRRRPDWQRLGCRIEAAGWRQPYSWLQSIALGIMHETAAGRMHHVDASKLTEFVHVASASNQEIFAACMARSRS